MGAKNEADLILCQQTDRYCLQKIGTRISVQGNTHQKISSGEDSSTN